MRREIAWLLVAKLVALALLWMFFFSPAHRPRVDGGVTGRRLAVDCQSVNAPASGETGRKEQACD